MGNTASSCPWAMELMGFGPARCAAADAPDSVQVNGVSFQVVRTLGEGGYAVVFAAREVASQRRVALKRIRFPADALPAVEREIGLHMEAARTSPAVVQVVDVELRRPGAAAANGGARWGGSTGPGSPTGGDDGEETAAGSIGGGGQRTLRSHDGECWIVLELCEGGGAAQLVEECIAQARNASAQRPSGIPRSLPPTYGAVPLPVIFCVLDNAIRALAALHRLDPALAHWDVKLENILLQGDVGCGATLHDDVVTATAQTGRYPLVFKLCDFGSATRARIAPCANGAQVARASVLLEQRTTLLYKAPEAIDLWSRRAVDTKADVWALGVVLYVLLCGRMPFDENPLQISKAAYTPIPVALREESCPLAPLVAFVTDGLLVEDPSARWSVFELSRRLAELTPLHQAETGPANAAAQMPDIAL